MDVSRSSSSSSSSAGRGRYLVACEIHGNPFFPHDEDGNFHLGFVVFLLPSVLGCFWFSLDLLLLLHGVSGSSCSCSSSCTYVCV